jgi:hypothetical protein
VIPGSKIVKGSDEGINGSSNTRVPSRKLLIKDKRIPVKLPKAPKKAYSKNEI